MTIIPTLGKTCTFKNALNESSLVPLQGRTLAEKVPCSRLNFKHFFGIWLEVLQDTGSILLKSEEFPKLAGDRELGHYSRT
jgi:hypothetical protein